MAEAVYVLCALTSTFCAALLLRTYRKTRTDLLLWSSLCFAGLAVNNIILVFDTILVKNIDFSLWRNATALLSIGLMLYGLISESK